MANLSLIEEYARKLEQEQMDVADATHSDPNSAEEGRRQFYENNPAMKRYRHRQAQGKAIKQDPDYYSKLADSMPVSGDSFGVRPIFRQEETDIPSVSNQVLSDTAATIAQIPDATAGAFKQGAGGLLQSLGTPGEQPNYAGPMQAVEMFSDALKSRFGKPVLDYGEDLYETGTQQYQQAYEQAPYKMPLEIGANVANMIPPVVGGIVTRNPVVALSPIFGQVYGSKFAQSRAEGRSPEEAHMDGTVFGGAEALSELIPLGFITKIGGNFVWNAAKSGMAEAIQEPVNQIIQNLYDVGVLDKEMTLDEALGGIKHAAQVGGAAGVILSALAAPFTRSRGTVPPVAPEDIPNLPALPQGPAQDVGPSATQDPYRTPPSFGPVDPSRRQFLQNVGDIATVAATTPTDLLPNLAEAAPAAVETAAPVAAPKISMDYLNLPMPTDYVFDINGKTLYAMTPDHIDIEQGETFVQFTDEMGGDDLPGGVSNIVDIRPYLDPVEDISQRDIDKAVARAIQDTFVHEGDEFFLGDVRRYYDEAGNNAEHADPFEIRRMEAQNDPEGIFDEVMLQREARRLGTNRDDKRLGGYSRFETTPTEPRLGGTPEPTEPRVQKRPILRDPTELEDSDFDPSAVEELARDKEVTEAIPRLPVLDRKLSEARDRLKSLEAGNPPPGFEDDYTQEEIEEDIRIEKNNIAALEKERRIKQEEPLEGEVKEVDDKPAVDAAAPTGPRVDAEIDPNAKRVNKTKKVKGRTYRFYGAEHLPGVDINRIINKVDLKGRGKDVIDVAFLYVPASGRPAIESVADSFIQGLGTVFGRAQGQASGKYKIAINLARFDKDGITEVLVTQADRLGISVEELMKRIGNENLQEYAIRTTLQHEITHVNHFIWENALLGESGAPSFSNSKRLQKWRRDLYKTYRQELLDFMEKDDKAYHRIGLGMEVDSNQEAVTFLDNLMREASKPTASSGTRFDASRRMWSVLSELLAYQSDSKNIETWTTKFKRVVKMLLAKVGINVGKDDLNDLMDDLYATGNIRQNLKPVRVLKEGPILSEEAKTEEAAREVRARMEGRDLEVGTPIRPAKFSSTNEILRKNNVSEKVISDISKTLSLEERELPISDVAPTLETVFDLPYNPVDLAGRLSDLAKEDKDEYSRLIAMIETSDRLFNLDMELYEGREDINTGNAISDLESEIVDILGPVDQTEAIPPDFDEDAWVQAWSEPKDPKKKKNYTEQFEDVMNNQAGNTETPGYTSPLSQELDRSDDAAQREYTGADSVSRPKARERTMLRNTFQHLYSRAAQTVRRHSGASKTAGLIADMILRAPHVKLREKETKAGRDYVQKKSMAMGEFRLDIQRALDELTNRGGVIPKKVNDQLVDYFMNGTMPRNGRVAAAAAQLDSAVEKLYAWSDRVGKKHTEDFSLRPVDGGKLPRVYDTDKVASPEGRKKLMDLLEGIGIVNDPANDKYDATDVYNIILNSGGFVSGDFTQEARKTGIEGMQDQRELFDRIEREIPRDQLGDLLLTDYQAIIPRFVDKAVEKTVYAELFGHKNEHLIELKNKVREEVEQHNRDSDTYIEVDYVMKSIDNMMDIIHHRYKVNMIPTRGRKFIQATMNATTMASLTLVSLASMPEFFTATALGSKNPAKFATNIMGAATYSALKGLNGMNKLLTGRVMKGYFDPKTKVGKRAKFLRELGLYDISSLGEAAAQRYVGPSFIKAGVGSTGNSLGVRALYRLYGLGNLEKGRFRARQGRALMNMDTYFEINMLTTMTQMQQMMALKNLEQNIVSDAKALSKASKGKGMKLKSTIAQIKTNLKGYGLSDSEINELVRWYDAGHRNLWDVPGEFKLDLAGPAHRFVQTVITLPSEGSLPVIFRNPAFAPFLLFKSFITTFGNTFINTIAQRLRFAEGTGMSKKYQQSKQIAGLMGTAAAMYGAVQFAQAIGYLIKYGEDDDPWEEKIGDFSKFLQDFERTGLFGPLGSLMVQIATPNYWSWSGKDPYDDLMDYVVGPVGRQARNIGKTGVAIATGKDLDLEGRLAKAVPLTKSAPIREAIGAEPYYTKTDKGKMIRRKTLEKREEKKAAKAEAKRKTILDSIPSEASRKLGLSKSYIVNMSKKELDQYIKRKTGVDVDGRKSKLGMLEEMLEKQ